jgi:hypothetical protein
MRRVTATRSIRPRLLLLPLVFGMLVMPAFLRTAAPLAADESLHSLTACSDVERIEKRRLPAKMPSGPRCASCRAPLLDAPLAHVERPLPVAAGDAPPAA